MSPYISLISIISRVPRKVHTPLKKGNVIRRRQDTTHGVDVVLGADVHKPQRPRRQSRHRVVVMCCSEVPALVLVRDIIAQRRSRNPWCAVRVEIGVRAGLADFGGGDVGDGATETVSYDDDLVRWVSGGDGFEGREHARAGFEPAVVAMSF